MCFNIHVCMSGGGGGSGSSLVVFRPFICVESSIIIPKCCQLEELGSSHLNSMCVLKDAEGAREPKTLSNESSRSGSHSALDIHERRNLALSCRLANKLHGHNNATQGYGALAPNYL